MASWESRYCRVPSGNQLDNNISYWVNIRNEHCSQGDLLLGVLDGVGTVADITADGESVVTADGS
jgi:hypothetical protein